MRNMQYWRVHVCLPLSFKGSQSRRGPTPHHIPWMPPSTARVDPSIMSFSGISMANSRKRTRMAYPGGRA